MHTVRIKIYLKENVRMYAIQLDSLLSEGWDVT